MRRLSKWEGEPFLLRIDGLLDRLDLDLLDLDLERE